MYWTKERYHNIHRMQLCPRPDLNVVYRSKTFLMGIFHNTKVIVVWFVIWFCRELPRRVRLLRQFFSNSPLAPRIWNICVIKFYTKWKISIFQTEIDSFDLVLKQKPPARHPKSDNPPSRNASLHTFFYKRTK